MAEITLTEKKSFKSPSIFINPQSNPEGDIIKEVVLGDSENNIDGVVVNIADLKVLTNIVKSEQTELTDYNRWEEKVLIMNPILPSLSTKSNGKIKRVIDMFDFGSELKKVVEKYNNGKSKNKVRQEDLYPLLEDKETIKEILNKQLKIESDILVPPVVKLTAKRDFKTRINSLKNIFETVDDLKTGNNDNNDNFDFKDKKIMFLFSIRPSVLEPPSKNEIISILEENLPDIIGFELRDMDYEKTDTNKNLFEFLQKIKKKFSLPLLLFNIDEGGYLSYYYGVDVISLPIASIPWFRQPSEPSVSIGKYYHPKKMRSISISDLKEETKDEDYRLPCNCEFCEEKKKLTNIDTRGKEWSEFRKKHYLSVKNLEIKKLRGKGSIRGKLHELFKNSKIDYYDNYLPSPNDT
ncbi:MAG: hypothetical protein ACOC5T_00380 [Elusimicrobiota bacterium]